MYYHCILGDIILTVFICRAESGFKRVEPTDYKPRLMKFNDMVY